MQKTHRLLDKATESTADLGKTIDRLIETGFNHVVQAVAPKKDIQHIQKLE